MNDLEAVRDASNYVRTPQDKGWVVDIRIKQYDNGMISVGCIGCDKPNPIGTNNISDGMRPVHTMRFVAQIMEEFFAHCERERMKEEAE